jgi:hypothetical protein
MVWERRLDDFLKAIRVIKLVFSVKISKIIIRNSFFVFICMNIQTISIHIHETST